MGAEPKSKGREDDDELSRRAQRGSRILGNNGRRKERQRPPCPCCSRDFFVQIKQGRNESRCMESEANDGWPATFAPCRDVCPSFCACALVRIEVNCNFVRYDCELCRVVKLLPTLTSFESSETARISREKVLFVRLDSMSSWPSWVGHRALSMGRMGMEHGQRIFKKKKSPFQTSTSMGPVTCIMHATAAQYICECRTSRTEEGC